MKRRHFLRNGLLASAAMATTHQTASLFAQADGSKAAQPFKLRYAPHPGMFEHSAGKDIIDQIKFAAAQGFRAWEDNGAGNRTPELQSKIGETLEAHQMKMGVFVAYASFDQPVFANPDSSTTEAVLQAIDHAIEVAPRVKAKYVTVVPGSVDQQHNKGEQWNRYGGPRLAEGYQTANAIELLRRCSEKLEPHGITMVLEPLNWHANHGGTLLRYSDQAYALCKAVNSPSCKILFDIYHQQISEGNLIPNIEACWDEIAYFQAGDNPGRKEPGTGEINYRNVFRYIHERSEKEGRDLIIGMEHGKSIAGKEGENALLQAYRSADAF